MLTRQKRSRDNGNNDGAAAAAAPAVTPPAKVKNALAKIADYNQLKHTTPSSMKRISKKPIQLINENNNNDNDNGVGGGGSPTSSLGDLSSSSTKGKSSFSTIFFIAFIYSN